MILQIIAYLLCWACLCSCRPQPGPSQGKMVMSSSVSGSLGGTVVLPCHFDIKLPSPSTPTTAEPVLSTEVLYEASPDEQLRIKWTKQEGEGEKVVMVTQGGMQKVGPDYIGRVALPSHPMSIREASLMIVQLRASDAGLYKCEVMHGIEDSHVTAILSVAGVVFHYRTSTNRYTLNFSEAVETCSAIGGTIATPAQLFAAFEDGFDHCDAGWLSDHSVRYPIAVPRPGCMGDLHTRPGVRTYGVRDVSEKYDVYCYVDQLNGEVFFLPITEKLTLEEAREECEKNDAELASPGQLYAAWRAGLNHCNYGWLSDGSVRYPVTFPRPQCGGGLLGVRTLYKYENLTGFPDPTDKHSAYCFKVKQPEPTTIAPPMTQAVYEPDRVTHCVHMPTPGPMVPRVTFAVAEKHLAEPAGPQMDRLWISTKSPTHRSDDTTSTDQHRPPHTVRHHVHHDGDTFETPTPMPDDYDAPDYEKQDIVEAAPIGRDTLIPIQLPPGLTTHRSITHDIFPGREEEGQGGLDKGATSGEEAPTTEDVSRLSAEGAEDTSTQVWNRGLEPTPTPGRHPDQVTPEDAKQLTPDEVTTDQVIPELLIPDSALVDVGHIPDGHAGGSVMFDLDQSLAIPVVKDSSAKPPFHVIIVNVHGQNQSQSVDHILEILNQPSSGVDSSQPHFPQITDLSGLPGDFVPDRWDSNAPDPSPIMTSPTISFVNGKHELP